MNRRSFLVALGAALAVGCTGGSGSADGLPFDADTRKVLVRLGELASAAKGMPQGKEAALAALKTHASLPAGDEAAITAALVAQIQADFDAEDTVSAGGWLLSKTEALVAAAL